MIYASEADILNKALSGKLPKNGEYSQRTRKYRDYADVLQLIVLANLETLNATFINQGISQKNRLLSLNQIAISQINSLLGNKSIKRLEAK